MHKIESFIGEANKNRLIDCIRGKPVDRVPNFKILLEDKHVEKLLGRYVGVPIMFHSDGRIDDAIDMLLDMGIECITPMDSSGIDYRDYKKRYGNRVTLHGNMLGLNVRGICG